MCLTNFLLKKKVSTNKVYDSLSKRLIAEWTHRTSSRMSKDTLQKCSIMSFFNIDRI